MNDGRWRISIGIVNIRNIIRGVLGKEWFSYLWFAWVKLREVIFFRVSRFGSKTGKVIFFKVHWDVFKVGKIVRLRVHRGG